MIPGSNILAQALGVIGLRLVSYMPFTGIEKDDTGREHAQYGTPQLIKFGSVQPVDRARYTYLGLDFQKNYVTWYVPNTHVASLSRDPDNSGDVINWPVDGSGNLISDTSRRFQLIGGVDWFNIDGWNAALCVDIGPGSLVQNN